MPCTRLTANAQFHFELGLELKFKVKPVSRFRSNARQTAETQNISTHNIVYARISKAS